MYIVLIIWPPHTNEFAINFKHFNSCLKQILDSIHVDSACNENTQTNDNIANVVKESDGDGLSTTLQSNG